MSQQTSQSNQQTSRQELLLKLAELQRAIQKWHNALRRQTGDIAANPITGQGRVLSVLAESGDMPQRDMSSRLGITPQSLGEMLVKLERAGYITREATGTGAHTLSVSITDAGRERVDKHGDFTTLMIFRTRRSSSSPILSIAPSRTLTGKARSSRRQTTPPATPSSGCDWRQSR